MTPILSKPKNYIAMEIIDFQDTSFGMKIESIVTDIKDDLEVNQYPGDKFDDSPLVKKLAEVIKDRIGLSVKIETSDILAAILPFYSNKHHIFLNEFWKGDFTIPEQEKILRKSNGKKGTVDLKKAKLGGIFTENVNPLYINFETLFKVVKMTPAEVTGVILHELGHGFEVCEYSDRLDSCNQVLSDLALNVLSKKEKDLTYIYKELQKFNDKVKEEEVEKMVNGNRIIAGYYWYKYIIEAVGVDYQSQMRNHKYDETSFENLADNFANRFGYGRQLITGLDKLTAVYGLGWEKSKSISMFFNLLNLLYFCIIVTVAILSFTVALPYSIMMGLFAILIFVSSGEGSKDMTYDELKIRYKRIRNDLVEFLKSNKLDKETINSVLKDLYAIDEIIKSTNQHWTFIQKLSNLIIPHNRRADNSISDQQLLEDLAFNDLFVKAAEFKTIS